MLKSSMTVLRLSLLGPFYASLDQRPIDNFKTLKVQALLIYLAMERDHSHQRESLMEFLWPDTPPASAQVNLRQTLYRLRQSIPEVGSLDGGPAVPLLLSDSATIRLNPQANLQLDVDQFLDQLESDPSQAINLYRGDFLVDFSVADSHAFEAWAGSVREELRRQALDCLDQMTQGNLEQGDIVQAQSHAWRQLEIDPFREKAYRQLMVALVKDGQRSAALAQYQICRQRLKEKRGVDPGQETLELYEQIQAEALDQVQSQGLRTTGRVPIDMPVFLLTDIEGSTRLWDRYHQEMLPALFQHNQILEKNIAQYGGRILELRGDGVKAVFEGGDPLACLISIQKAFGHADWGEIGSLRIRAGLHGVPEVRKGYDYFKKDDKYYGPVLNHTARIMDAGWGGQVLVSETIHNAIPLPPGANWQDFGIHSLKSLDQPVHIFGLVHPDMPVQAFPPLRTGAMVDETPKPLPPIRHNLPPQPTPFVGRKSEIASLIDRLVDPHIPLVSLVGPGGMGKTRLALAVAEEFTKGESHKGDEHPFPDGIFFVPLAPLNDPEQIIPTVAKALNIPIEANPGADNLERGTQSTTSQRESLLGYLGSKRLLILLDNFEHLLEGAEIVAEILNNSPSIHVLVTSRERLQLLGEQVYPIQGLEFPDWEAPQDPCEFTAMELFMQSARRLQPEFQLDPGDMVYLTRICNLVGGMPLGLELAASWVDILSLEEIAAEIKTSIDFLETEVRNVPQRHRSIRAVFDSSWNRLSQAEKSIFPRLSIFRGSFTREAAYQVAQASLRDLATFTSKSLLQYDQESHRYQIHELLRQYGAERLDANPAIAGDTQRRHCRYFCFLISQHVDLLLNGDTDTALERIGNDFANILKAWDWAIQEVDLPLIDKALGGLCFSYDFLYEPEKGLAVCQAAYEALEKHGIPETAEDEIQPDAVQVYHLQARILYWQGYLQLYYQHELAKKYLGQSMAIIDRLLQHGVEMHKDKIYVLFYRGLIDLLSGDPQESKPYFLESLKISRATGVQWMELRALSVLGDVARASGHAREAQRWFGECLAQSRTLNNYWGEIRSLINLGWVARQRMAYDEAEGYFQESLALANKEGKQWEIVHIRESLGWLSLFLGHLSQAEEHFTQAVAISDELGTPYRSLPSKIHTGIAYWLSGDFVRAEQIIQAALATSQELSYGIRIFPTVCAAELMLLLGRNREAHEYLTTLDTLTRNLFIDRFAQGRITRVKGIEALAARDYTTARGFFEKSIELFTQNSDDEQIAWSQAGLARAMIGQGLMEQAQQVLIEALWTAIEIKGFIPLVFILPVAVLYLADEDPVRAGEVYQQIMQAPFIARAAFFSTTIYPYLPAEVTNLQAQTGHQDGGTLKALWAAAASILSSWIQVWIELEEKIKKDP